MAPSRTFPGGGFLGWACLAAGAALLSEGAAAEQRPYGDGALAKRIFAELKGYYRREGLQAAVAAVNNEGGRFRDKKPALWIKRIEPKFELLAHNKLPSVVGVDIWNVQDFQGDYFIRDFLERIREQPSATFEPVHSIPNYGEVHHSHCYGDRGPRYAATGIVLGYCYTVAYPAKLDDAESSQ